MMDQQHVLVIKYSTTTSHNETVTILRMAVITKVNVLQVVMLSRGGATAYVVLTYYHPVTQVI